MTFSFHPVLLFVLLEEEQIKSRGPCSRPDTCNVLVLSPEEGPRDDTKSCSHEGSNFVVGVPCLCTGLMPGGSDILLYDRNQHV